MSFQNQLIVKLAPRAKRDKDNLYAMFNMDALQNAMRDLKGNSLKLWVYLNKNQDGYQFDLSPKACLEWGLKKDSFYAARTDLIEKGYLRQIHKLSNIFMFYEDPRLSENQSLPDCSDFTEDDSVYQNDYSETPYRNNKYNTSYYTIDERLGF